MSASTNEAEPKHLRRLPSLSTATSPKQGLQVTFSLHESPGGYADAK